MWWAELPCPLSIITSPLAPSYLQTRLTLTLALSRPHALPPHDLTTSRPPAGVCNGDVQVGGESDGVDGHGANRLGLYERRGLDANGNPYYQHSSGSYFMYLYVRDTERYWFLGEELGENWRKWEGRAGISDPTDVNEWAVYNGTDKVWYTHPGLTAVCTRNVTFPYREASVCNGDVRIHGENDGFNTDRLGLYERRGLDVNGNPYYQHSSGSYFMQFDDTDQLSQRWYLRSALGARGGLWNGRDSINDPTGVNKWKVYNGTAWVVQPGVTAVCTRNREAVKQV